MSFLFYSQESQSDWKLRKDDDGILVYTRSVEGSSFDEFKGSTKCSNTSLKEVLDVVLDVKNYPDLFPDCIEAKILLQKGKYYDIHYFSVQAPWPVKNRDAVYESVTTFNKDSTYARIELKPRGDYIKEKKNFIRLYKGEGFWEIDETDPSGVQVIYQFHGDPGGKIPAWLANSSVVSNPFETLTNLKSRVKR